MAVGLAMFLWACPGAEDDCARDADCPEGSRCVQNGEHRVCLGGEGGGGPCADRDGDGVCDDVDLCPEVPDPGQEDADGDGVGDACDPCPADPENDGDGDGVCGGVDNCPAVANPGQEDADGDGVGDACDPCPGDPEDDADGDGICGDVDNCPAAANPGQEDADGDGAGDACDPCPRDPEDDADGDGICGDVDNCPAVANPGQEDLDGDEIGDACDPDVDGDGVPAPADCAPRDPAVYPGAPDPCDGVDTDCVPGRCSLEVDPEAAGLEVQDVTCAPGSGTCAVALRGADETGRIVVLGMQGTPEALGTIPAAGVLGVAALDDDTGPEIWSVSPGRIKGHGTDGILVYELEAEAQTLTGNITLRLDTLGLATHSEISTIQFFSPFFLQQAGPGTTSCGSTNPGCKSIGLIDLHEAGITLGARQPARVALRHDSRTVPAQGYVTFFDDDRLAVAVVGVNGTLHETACGLLTTGVGNSGLLALTPSGDTLFVVGAEGAAAVTTASTAAGHVAHPFTLAACPTAILARDHELLVASHCQGEDPELIALPILEGLPGGSAAVTLPIPGCTPHRMAETSQAGGGGPGAVLLGCRDSETVLVIGRD